MKLLSDIDVSGKKVFLRADLDVLENVEGATNGDREANREGDLENSSRLQNLKPTIDWLLEHGTKQVIIAGHLDSPGGKPDMALSSEQLIRPLEKILKRSVVFKGDLEIPEPGSMQSLSQLVLLENLRFWPGEEGKDPQFTRQLAQMVDVYINDAFATCHRDHASMAVLPTLFAPEARAAGIHLEEEIKVLTDLLKSSENLVAIIGGAKIRDKIPAIENLSLVADTVLVGGILPREIEKEGLRLAEKVVVARLTPDGKDIDQVSIDNFVSKIKAARKVVWNGPMGYFEGGFENGTLAVAHAILDSGAYSVVGGGNTDQFLQKKNLHGFSFVSSGGGAMLEFLAGKQLPGLVALE